MARITVNGIEINHRIGGREGSPWVTFSNSLATSLDLWDAQVALLEDDFRILRYDQRGHGGTDASLPPYNFDLLARDVIALWDALGVERSIFVGLSMGGTTGLGIAIDHGARLAGLVACDCRCDSPPGFREAWDGRIALVRDQGMAALADPTVERWFTEGFRNSQPDRIEWIRDMIRTTPADGFIGCANALQNIAYRDGLARIATPTLFIAGAQDPAATPDYIKPMQEAVAGAGFVLLDPAGHISNVENPDGFNRALGDFVNSL